MVPAYRNGDDPLPAGQIPSWVGADHGAVFTDTGGRIFAGGNGNDILPGTDGALVIQIITGSDHGAVVPKTYNMIFAGGNGFDIAPILYIGTVQQRSVSCSYSTV